MASSHSKTGSALLMTLLVTSLLMVVTISFSAFVRLELQSVQRRAEAAQAQAHAKVSMHLALNQLQTLTGVDQRVTAHADILGSGAPEPEARFWTGVWASDGAGGVLPSPVWLVSGSNPDPASGAGADSTQLFPAVNSYAPVEVPVESFTDPAGDPSMELAYWVSDEASKASLVSRRDALSTYTATSLSAVREEVEGQSNFGVSLQPFFVSAESDLSNDTLSMELERAANLTQFLYARDSAAVPLVLREAELPRHDLTLQARGVIENSVDGGLKRNLSDNAFRDSFLATDDTMTYLGPKGGVLQAENRLPSDLGYSPGEPFFSPRPLLTEAVLYIGLFHTWSDARVRIRFHMQGEFLNPYTLPLRFPRDPDSRWDRGLVLYFDNLPTIEVRDLSRVAPTLTEDLNELSAYASSDTRRYLNSWFEISPDGIAHTPELQPGEVYQVMEPNPATQPRGLARNFTNTRWSASSGTRPADNALIRITATHPAGGVTLRAVPYGGNPRNNPEMLEYRGLDFDDFRIQKRFNSGPNPFSRGTSSSYVVDDYNFAYHFRLYSDQSDPGSLADFLGGAYAFDPDFSSSEAFTDSQGNALTHGQLLDPISNYPPDIVADTLNLFSSLDQFMDRSARSHVQNYRLMPLIDVPDGDVFSVGQLSSLPIYKRPARFIGSAAGGDLNAAYDRYYFSPKALHPDTLEPYPLSPAIDFIASGANAADSEDAANELIDGQFNINSTSISAWEALLAAPDLTAAALDEAAVDPVSREGIFHRLPFFQQNNPDFVVSRSEMADPDNAFAQGIRAVDNSDSDPQLREMARRIVTRLRARGRPFSSVQGLANSGILQQAIEEVNQSSTNPEINETLFAQSNVELSQQDVLHKLAPVAAPRSDTFVIRAMGRKLSPGGEQVSEALCEAVVQRIPDKLDGSDPLTAASSIANLRRFEIVSFRWLSDAED